MRKILSEYLKTLYFPTTHPSIRWEDIHPLDGRFFPIDPDIKNSIARSGKALQVASSDQESTLRYVSPLFPVFRGWCVYVKVPRLHTFILLPEASKLHEWTATWRYTTRKQLKMWPIRRQTLQPKQWLCMRSTYRWHPSKVSHIVSQALLLWFIIQHWLSIERVSPIIIYLLVWGLCNVTVSVIISKDMRLLHKMFCYISA